MLKQLHSALETQRGMALALLVLTLLFFIPGQNTIPPWDRDESRFAQATRQMLETGDFVDIRFQDAPRHLQPAGIYWLQSATVAVFGNDAVREIWPHRMVSWLGAIASVFLTWWVGALLFGKSAGRIAALLMAASITLAVESRMAKIDATLCATTLLAQIALAKIYLGRITDEARKARPWAALFWIALGAGVLLKGPVVLLVSGGTLLGLLLLERRFAWLSRLNALWGVPLMLLVAAPWYIAIAYATDGDFYRKALGYSVVGKITESHQSHGGPPGYHLAAFTIYFWPGSLLGWLAIPFAWAERRSDAVRFCIAWIVPAWLFFELSGTKLPHYTLPLFPAVAALAAAAFLNAGKKPAFGRPILFAVVSLIWLVASIVPVFSVFIAAQQSDLPTLATPLNYALGGLAMALVLAVIVLVWIKRPGAALAALISAGLVAHFNIFGLAVPRQDQFFLSPRIIAAMEAARPCPTTQLASYPYHEPSLVFLDGGDTLLVDSAEEAAAHLNADPRCGLALVGAEQDAAFHAALAQGVAVEAVGRIDGYNYNEGDMFDLTLYRVQP